MSQLSPEVEAQLKEAVQVALAKGQDQPLVAQGFLGLPTPSLNLGDAKSTAITVLDDTIKALEAVLKYGSWIIPDQYELPLKALDEALNKVKGLIS
jgi:hypothetical protein